MKHPSIARLIPCARKLRKNETDVENILWQRLRGRRFAGVKFKRQQPLGEHIVDFVSLEKKLVIELDGGQHLVFSEKDHARDAWIQEQGFKVVRFWDSEVLCNLEGVILQIRTMLDQHHSHSTLSLALPPQGGGNNDL